jgi:hypothetical protein
MPSLVGPAPYWVRHGGRVCIVKLGAAKLLYRRSWQPSTGDQALGARDGPRSDVLAIGAGLAATPPRTTDQFRPARLISP